MNRILLFCLLSVCLSPAFSWESDDSTAKDDTQTYHLYDGIDLISTLKFQYEKKIMAKSVFPQLAAYNMSEELDVFNNMVVAFVQQQFKDFKARVVYHQNLKGVVIPDKKNHLYLDYSSSTIKSGNEHIMSIRFSIQGSIAGASSPYHYHRVLNYDLDTRQQINLDDLFKPNSPYLTAIAKFVHGRMAHKYGDKLIVNGLLPTPDNYQNWNIKPLGLVFTFDEAQIAPEIYGAQTVFVPFSVLKSFLSAESPIAACIKAKWRCKQHNLVTGGFMEEAQMKSVLPGEEKQLAKLART